MKKLTTTLPVLLFPTLLSAQTSGSLTEEHWNNISGLSVVDFQQAIAARPADTVLLRSAAEAPVNSGSNYGRRMRGSITAPVTGAYTFFIAGDNNVSLSLSSDASGLHKKEVAFHSNYTAHQEWFRYETQRSQVIYLEAGQEYFIEALQKESSGGDHLSIGWSYTADELISNNLGSAASAVWTNGKGTHTVAVGDGDFSSDTDNYAFAGRSVSGDFDAVVKVANVQHAGEGAQLGLMARGSTVADAMTVAVLQNGDRSLQVESRVSDGGSYYTGSPSAHGASWIKLSRRGNVFHAYESGDGASWIYKGKYTRNNFPAEVTLGLAAANNGGVQDLEVTFTDFQIRATTADEVIPAEYLTSFVADENDADGNGLDDTWESQNPLTGSAFDQSEFGDPDGDLISNLEESLLGSDPTDSSSKQGHCLLERWTSTIGYDVSDLLVQDAFYNAPNSTSLVKGIITANSSYDGARMRAYITAPETGEYRFWISSKGGAELWLSSDETKYRKQRIAVMGSAAGTGHGVVQDSFAIWDTFASQMSEPVFLEAGQRHFIEHLSQNGHVSGHNSIAWARPGQERELIDSQFFSSYAKQAEDSDDDSLPDTWETQHSLSATDNGLVNREQEGENGDFDYDGLSNRLEYVYGTDPSNPDSDGDGVNDGQEIYSYGSDPVVNDAPAETLFGSVDLTTFINADAEWISTEEGLISTTFRGGLEWSFTVPTDGHWNIHLNTKLLGSLYLNEKVPASVAIDGNSIWSDDIVYGQQREALVRVTTPFLTAGQHTVRLNIDNMSARRKVSITSLEVYQPSGIDNNSNGTPDWIDSQLAGANTLLPYLTQSRTSPAFLEGSTRVFADTVLNGNSVLEGAGSNGWYANLSLNKGAPTDFIVGFESGLVQGGTIKWKDTNVLDNETMVIRKGDSLKLSVSPSTTGEFQGGTITFTQHPTLATDGTISFVLGDDGDDATYQFVEAGSYVIDATHVNGESGTLNLEVKQADFSTVAHDIVSNSVASVALPSSSVDSDLTFDLGNQGVITSAEQSGDSLNLKVSSQAVGNIKLAARLYDGGPILNTKELNMISVSGALQNDANVSFNSMDFEGYKIVNTPIVVTNLPEGGRVKVTIFRSGVTFLDGTTVMWIDADDLVNGVINLQFLFPTEMSGGYCHYLDVYDRDGAYLGRQ